MFIDSRDLRLLAAQGMTMSEIARELDQPYYRVRKTAQLLGIEVVHDPRGRPSVRREPKAKEPKEPRRNAHSERNERMARMFKQGVTLEKIGQTFNVTRERVRQVLRVMGVASADGGKHISARAKAQDRHSQLNARSLIKYGLPRDEMNEARAKGLTRAFQHQRQSAAHRGIEWGLTFAQWLQVWTLSGRLDQRGRGKGCYCMSRIKDSGGYVIGNVHIQLNDENGREAVSKWKGKTKSTPGVFLLYPGMKKPYMAKAGRKSLGLFATEEEAVQARIQFAAANGYSFNECGRIKKAA